MKLSKADRIFNLINGAILFLFTLIMLYPLYFIIIASFSDPGATVKGLVMFRPVGFQFTAYQNVLKESSVWIGYRNTILYTVLGTAYNLALTIPAAYVLTKKQLPGHSALTWYFFITMYFGGGMIPTYLLIKSLGLLNSPLALILGGVNCWNLIVTRQFFATSIPEELYESADIDGASQFRIFFSIALPLAAPIVAVMSLYFAVSHWNSYYSALLYVRDANLYPLQLVLRNILISNQMALSALTLEGGDTESIAAAAKLAYMAESMKYALIFIASAPMLCIYPFVQKYFVKGVMVGSIKG